MRTTVLHFWKKDLAQPAPVYVADHWLGLVLTPLVTSQRVRSLSSVTYDTTQKKMEQMTGVKDGILSFALEN